MEKGDGKNQFQQSGLKIPPVEGRYQQQFALPLCPSLCSSWCVFPVPSTHDGSGSGVALLLSLTPSTALLLFCLSALPGHVNEHWFFSMHGFLDWFLVGNWQCPSSMTYFSQAALAGSALHPSGVGCVTLRAAPVAVEIPQETQAQRWSGSHLGQGFTCRTALLLQGTRGNLSVWAPALGTRWNVPFPRIWLLWDGEWGSGGVTPRVVPWLLFQGCQHWTAPQNQMLTCKEGSKGKKKLKTKEETLEFFISIPKPPISQIPNASY